jgi:hypothetical protein
MSIDAPRRPKNRTISYHIVVSMRSGELMASYSATGPRLKHPGVESGMVLNIDEGDKEDAARRAVTAPERRPIPFIPFINVQKRSQPRTLGPIAPIHRIWLRPISR